LLAILLTDVVETNHVRTGPGKSGGLLMPCGAPACSAFWGIPPNPACDLTLQGRTYFLGSAEIAAQRCDPIGTLWNHAGQWIVMDRKGSELLSLVRAQSCPVSFPLFCFYSS
jgi:hypothetical protein